MIPDDVDTDLLRAALDERRPHLPVEAVVSGALCVLVGVLDVVRGAFNAWWTGGCIFVGAFVIVFTLVRYRRHRRLWESGVESLERLERMKTR